MNSNVRIVLEVAANCSAMKRAGGGLYKPFRSKLRGASIGLPSRAIYHLVDGGMMAWVNNCHSAAVITEAGRAALAMDAR
jgi:hypothetical protein